MLNTNDPITVATLSRYIKTDIAKWFNESVDPEEYWRLDYALHDFGYRGCASEEQAVIGGMAHLLNFKGTDNIPAALAARRGESIPATEHSLMMAWPTEWDAVKNMIDKFGDSPFSVVADTYDYDNFLQEILPKAAPLVKEKGGHMVVRPDSGDPIKQTIKALKALEEYFGTSTNKKGYKVIQNGGVIYGDGLTQGDIDSILDMVTWEGYSAQNVVFGMGAGLLQRVERDDTSFATKLSSIQYADGTIRDVMKFANGKTSLPGELQVNLVSGLPTTYPINATWEDDRNENNELVTVFDNGYINFDAFQHDPVERLQTQWDKMPTQHNAISQQLAGRIEEVKRSL